MGEAGVTTECDDYNYICWALFACTLHADRCRRRDSVGNVRPHVPFETEGLAGGADYEISANLKGTWSSKVPTLSRRLQQSALSAAAFSAQQK